MFLSLSSEVYRVVLECAICLAQLVSKNPCRQSVIKHVYRCFSYVGLVKIATCPGPSLLSHCKSSPRVNNGWWEMKSRKEVTRALPWIVIDSFVWTYLLQKVKSQGGAGAEVQKKLPALCLYSECAVTHFSPVCEGSYLGSCCEILIVYTVYLFLFCCFFSF